MTSLSTMNREQRALLIQFLHENIDVARNSFPHTPKGRELRSAKWTELADMLNAVDGAIKTVAQWRKTWEDLRMRVREKIRLMKKLPKDGEVIHSRFFKPLEEHEKHVIALIEMDEDISWNMDDEESNDNQLQAVEVIQNPADSCKLSSDETIPLADAEQEISAFEKTLKEIEIKKLKIEQEKLDIEKEKLQLMKEDATQKMQIENVKLEVEKEKLRLMNVIEMKKINIEEEKLQIEKRKLQIMEEWHNHRMLNPFCNHVHK